MLPSVLKLRLQQLENNVTRVLNLLNAYEVELIDESDPSTKNKYRRRIEDLKQQRDIYEMEFQNLQEQLGNKESEEQASNITSQLQQIDSKLNWLADSQFNLYQAVLVHFTDKEQALIVPITRRLGEDQIVEVESVLGALESNQIEEEETRLAIIHLQKSLAFLQERGIELPNGNEVVMEIFNQPTLDAKHALKVSIPIIPFVLSYESELGLGTGIKLKETWEHWKSKLWNK